MVFTLKSPIVTTSEEFSFSHADAAEEFFTLRFKVRWCYPFYKRCGHVASNPLLSVLLGLCSEYCTLESANTGLTNLRVSALTVYHS